jgi:glyoxylase I family protein
MKRGFCIHSVDHTGITVTDLDRSLAFWEDVPGFQLSQRAHHTGELASEVTSVSGAEISIAGLQAPGHRIDRLPV